MIFVFFFIELASGENSTFQQFFSTKLAYDGKSRDKTLPILPFVEENAGFYFTV